MSGYKLVFYTTNANQSPVIDFLRSLDVYTRAKVDRIVAQLATLGPQIRPPKSKKITSHIFELRVRGKVEVRILYSFEGKTIWLWHAFVKKTMKIPIKEIQLAINRREKLLA